MIAALIKRHIALSICAACAIGTMIVVGVYFTLPDQVKRNRTRLVRALAKPRIEWSLSDRQGVERVVLGDGTPLVAEHDEVVAGYIVRLAA